MALCLAVMSPVAVQAVEPNPIEVGNLQFVPTLSMSATDDDNIFRNEASPLESWVYNIRPRLLTTLESGANQFTLDLAADKGEYAETDEDDYTDWNAALNADFELNSSNLLGFNLRHNDAHEFRGTGFSQGDAIPLLPDEYEEDTVGAYYQLGNNESLGRIRLNIGAYEKDYSNNIALTRYREREEDLWGAAFYWNLSPRTALVLEYRNREIEYGATLPGTASLNSEEQYVFVGIEWEATAATTGSLRIGEGEKDFVAAPQADQDLPSVEGDITWAPVDYSIVTLFASQIFDETEGFGNAVERRTAGVNWDHDWSQRFSSNVNITLSSTDHLGSTREDDYDTYSLGFTYSAARWLDFGVDFGREDRQSNVAGLSMDRNFIALRLDASL
jgi:hypothetical protein